MGDDAEYFAEQLAREEQDAELALESSRLRCEFCYIVDNEQNNPVVIFYWIPTRGIGPEEGVGWLFKLHNTYNIGKSVFYAKDEGGIDKNNFKKVDVNEYELEVLLVSRHELKNLKKQLENINVNDFEEDYFEEYDYEAYIFSEMIDSIINVIDSEEDVEEFTFILRIENQDESLACMLKLQMMEKNKW
ncbi:hypothetical protein BGP_0658 [Beggiatoa sp. PS]|nr:hypothetical protein BGP_0658 [Beggiatoa sp. PS]